MNIFDLSLIDAFEELYWKYPDIIKVLEINFKSIYIRYEKKIEKYYIDKFETIHINFEIQKFDNCILKGDKDRLIEVIQNVIENAIKYGDGEKISIEFSLEEGYELITIINTGCNLKEEDLPHIFDSFYRGSNSKNKEGSGLGLYICKQLMFKMDGSIYSKIKDNNIFETTIVIKKV